MYCSAEAGAVSCSTMHAGSVWKRKDSISPEAGEPNSPSSFWPTSNSRPIGGEDARLKKSEVSAGSAGVSRGPASTVVLQRLVSPLLRNEGVVSWGTGEACPSTRGTGSEDGTSLWEVAPFVDDASLAGAA